MFHTTRRLLGPLSVHLFPETSHLVRFGFRPENVKNRFEASIISSADSTFVTKK